MVKIKDLLLSRLSLSLIITLVLNIAFHLLMPVKPLMSFFANTTLAIRQALAAFFDLIPFSVAEMLILLTVILVLIYITKTIIDVIKSKNKGILIYKRIALAINIVLSVYLILNLFFGSSYYGKSFEDKSGIHAGPSSVEKLYEATKYFAMMAAETSDGVRRDENGIFNESIEEIFDKSKHIYNNSYNEFPFLEFKTNKPKRLLFSKLLSYISYTGFYFPFTGEANINIDAPACFIPATIVHEMAHQRGIAYEQEANFVAIYVSINSGEPIYKYSGYLLGFVHLNNALYKYDIEKYYEVYSLLSEEAKADLRYNNDYWASLDSPVSEITDMVYDTFLKSYGQELGLQSYGAVVDLLIEYYTN